jgi:hypothetical protein
VYEESTDALFSVKVAGVPPEQLATPANSTSIAAVLLILI